MKLKKLFLAKQPLLFSKETLKKDVGLKLILVVLELAAMRAKEDHLVSLKKNALNTIMHKKLLFNVWMSSVLMYYKDHKNI